MATNQTTSGELTVLDPRTSALLPLPPLSFSGLEHENFRHFRRDLESFILINGIDTNHRRVNVLQAVLRGKALAYFERVIKPKYKVETPDETDIRFSVSYFDALEDLQDHYVTEYDILRFRNRFETSTQRNNESPRSFLGRLRELAYEANVTDEILIKSRFKSGLLPEIKRHCILLQAITHEQVFNTAEGYWEAQRIGDDFSSYHQQQRRNERAMFTNIETQPESQYRHPYQEPEPYQPQAFQRLRPQLRFSEIDPTTTSSSNQYPQWRTFQEYGSRNQASRYQGPRNQGPRNQGTKNQEQRNQGPRNQGSWNQQERRYDNRRYNNYQPNDRRQERPPPRQQDEVRQSYQQEPRRPQYQDNRRPNQNQE
ncbi:hypothetical protein O0I10_012981 [Lichtheimia ornata]|uniref:Retrotransposon gag domain-containing protein n=1 Tax=Lichtheimia ornata TaxID=688661 RepID=A0AAD7UQW3_9FUNG|nr:uncharacterized protein O0I10_012981 [Lichtheimia ornata]KAJ8651463.1 hypothetical protein O0I10_012981 [Lichtheimia ornata]